MGESRKAKRVTWASDLNLCQVRLFLLEDTPSLVAIGTQDHLQAKAAGSVLRVGGSHGNLPPGFEAANSWKVKLSQIPIVKWKCPVRFKIFSEWRVVAAEESTEVEVQNQRELGVLEAIYPRPSAIPPNPSGLDAAEDSSNADQFIRVVPLTPIEEEDSSVDAQHVSCPAGAHTMVSQTPPFPHGSVSSVHGSSELLPAVQAALSSLMPGRDQGNLIDPELLLKILSDPKMIKQLVASHGSSSTSQSFPSSSSQIPTIGTSGFTVHQPLPASGVRGMQGIGMHNHVNAPPTLRPPPVGPLASATTLMTRPEVLVPPTGSVSTPFFPSGFAPPVPTFRPAPPAEVISAASPSLGLPPVSKDIGYYKTLIQQHGGERRELTPMPYEQMNLARPRDSKQRIMKLCTFFNTPKGCRNGANCAFLHELSPQLNVGSVPEVHSAKRVKRDRELTGL